MVSSLKACFPVWQIDNMCGWEADIDLKANNVIIPVASGAG